MTFLQRLFAIFFIFFEVSCHSGIGGLFHDYTSDKIISPSGKYYLITTVNRTQKSRNDYGHVVIHLYDSKGAEQDSVNTHAADSQKWAVGWDRQNDTVVLFSGDVENAAWTIENAQLKSIRFTDELSARAQELRKEKYEK